MTRRKTKPEQPVYASKAEVAEFLGISITTVDRLLADKGTPLRRIKVGRSVRIPWADVYSLAS